MKQNTDNKVQSAELICANENTPADKWYTNIRYLIVGILFGIIFIKAEVISWFRIQEMFRLQSFSCIK